MTDLPFLSAHKICKSFGPTRALVDVDVTVRRGEIRGLIGENGSGKSTFSSIVAGAQRSDSGTFELEGKPYDPKHMVDAQNHGISMIVQEMGTIGTISVASNIFIGRLEEYTKLGVVDFKTLNRKANEILASIGASDIKAETLTGRLNFEDRKIVEIARAMVCNPQLLIVDETTTALAHKGRTILYRLIKRMHDENKAVLFISHDLEELVEVCNTITVLRDGHIIDTLDEQNMSIPLMRNLMVGRELAGSYFREDYDGSFSDEVVLRAEHVTYGLLEDFSMELHKGEILGIGGLSACGMHELGKLLFGVLKTLTGKVSKDGVVIDSTVTAVQKVVFAKWLAKECDVFILDCPTRGIDVGVKASMYQLIYSLKKQGKSIIMISEELPELIGMSDRMMLMKDGKVSAYIDRNKSVTEQTVIEYII